MKGVNKPSYDIEGIKLAFKSVDQLNMTKSAMQGQYDLGFSDEDVVEVIQSLTSNDFYKSILPKSPQFFGRHDVYTPFFKGIELYIKFQVDNRGEVIISFKAKVE